MLKLSSETRKQQIFSYIQQSIAKNRYAPSLSEMAEEFHLSKTGVEHIIKKLVQDNKLQKTQEKIRNIKLS